MSIRTLIKSLFPNTCYKRFVRNVEKRFNQVKDPVLYTKDKYFRNFNVELDLENPKTFYEKINYLKLFHKENNPETLVDKVLVKDYLSQLNLDKHIARKIDSFKSFKAFKFFMKEKSRLYKSFVVKLNHTSGDVFFYDNNKWRTKTGDNISRRNVYACLKQFLKLNYYHYSFERVYENIVPQILVEEYISSENNKGLDEYKFFCNNGVVKMINVAYGRQQGSKLKEAFTLPDLSVLDARQNKELLHQQEIYKPKCFDDMIKFCEKTSKGYPILRVDLMVDGDTFRFCEFTFYDCSGNNIFYPLEKNTYIGNLFNIE